MGDQAAQLSFAGLGPPGEGHVSDMVGSSPLTCRRFRAPVFLAQESGVT